MKKILTLFILTAITFSFSQAQTFESKVDGLLNQIFKDKNGPGGVFLVARNGKSVYQKAFGNANIELGVKMQTQNVFQLGSMTKQFTAIAILMLVEQGKIDLQKPISAYIPDYPMGDQITVHHLLTHTSGIKDFTKMKSLNQIAQQNLSPKQMVDFFKNGPVDFNPGEKFEYNNSGYVILGYLIELVSGDTYENYLNKNIFEKIGMKHSRYASDVAIIKDRAYGYQQKTSGYVNKTAISFSIPFSSGALMSTVDDMLRWQNALNSRLILKSETIKKAFSKYKLNSGETFNYGYGWHLKDINGVATREHGGSIFGFKTMGVYIPEQDIYVLGLSNCDCNSPTQVVKDIATLALNTFGKN
ncbi:serine hydrolase domain-containing protein [Pedobacter sp. GR22-10]|uniref:serine hydrolase domain-containing protein n=1 Tax=Pedobacter sp. GR22-10 TaxID=2994472 RepID=UPI0022455657|nr:serine hydrolase domain-containing protein [Pedobacter sp. GR22-10]MCX2433040.1 serine hydrolase [Pedobacter sp. GR22-10]